MTELESVITGLIHSVKTNPEFDNIRFINAYNSKPAEKPVEGYLAIVEVAGVDDIVNLNIRLMGGDSITGSQLGYTAIELAAALKAADTEKIIGKVFLSETKHDKKIVSFYRDIKLSLAINSGFSLDSDIKIYIGQTRLNGVTAVKQDEIRNGLSLYEFNRAQPYAVINNSVRYEITLETTDTAAENIVDGFSLTFDNGSRSVCFTDCTVNKTSTSVNTKGQIVYSVKITSDRRQIV